VRCQPWNSSKPALLWASYPAAGKAGDGSYVAPLLVCCEAPVVEDVLVVSAFARFAICQRVCHWLACCVACHHTPMMPAGTWPCMCACRQHAVSPGAGVCWGRVQYTRAFAARRPCAVAVGLGSCWLQPPSSQGCYASTIQGAGGLRVSSAGLLGSDDTAGSWRGACTALLAHMVAGGP
jgi:hypothetical protein